MKKIYIFDDIVSFEKQEQIKNTLYGANFPWYYINDVAKIDNNKQKRPALTHLYLVDKKINSDYYRDIEVIFNNVSKKLKKKFEPVKVRSFMQFPLNKTFTKKQNLDTPHIDLNYPHTVFLYYVCDNEAETVIYDYKSKDWEDVPNIKDINIVKKIKPKQGRVVVFDGYTWHSSTQPSKNIRTIINFDVCTI